MTRQRGYRTARLVARLISGIGWSICVITAVLASVLYWQLGDPLVAVPASVAAFSGLLVVALGQVIRANLDTADQTREIRDLLWRQGGYFTVPRQGSAGTRKAESDSKSASTDTQTTETSSSSRISTEMAETVASQSAVRCVNPMCDRLLPETLAVCPHCGMRQSLSPAYRKS